MNSNRRTIPVSFFGIAVGALAFANMWRVAIEMWDLPASLGVALSIAALVVWLVILFAYGHKWFTQTADARRHCRRRIWLSSVGRTVLRCRLDVLACD